MILPGTFTLKRRVRLESRFAFKGCQFRLMGRVSALGHRFVLLNRPSLGQLVRMINGMIPRMHVLQERGSSVG